MAASNCLGRDGNRMLLRGAQTSLAAELLRPERSRPACPGLARPLRSMGFRGQRQAMTAVPICPVQEDLARWGQRFSYLAL